MARKKDNFDPLGGFVGGPAKPNKKSKRVNDLLGSGKNSGSGSIYDEGDNTPSYSGRTDALTATGEAVPEKKKKRGFFFGHKEKPQEIHEPPKDSGFDSSEYKIDIKGGLVDTGIAERYADDVNGEYEVKYEEEYDDLSEPAEEDDFFEKARESAHHTEKPEPKIYHAPNVSAQQPQAGVKHEINVKSEDVQKPEPVHPQHPNICCLCGEVSSDALPQFGFGDGSNTDDFVPLCKTCLHAVTTLMKFREPSDEVEIKSEWRTLCPGLDEEKASKIINEGRKYH